ncbi:MAG: sigma 54-interacting transcriptional regulator [Planctomycetes bacterium]|nr:sigma 54-interacting transcriptional regulator [Planctomycetota bacterium]
MNQPRTLGELKASGYQSLGIKDEMRRNLIRKLKNGEPIFDGILGYDETVLPQVQNAILSRHDMLFLGLRGQAKTRMLRQLVYLLDDAIPIVAGSEVNDDPLRPLSRYAKDLIARHGDDTPIDWIGPQARYHEKLATPDVTIADLIGEIDMIKHAEGRYLSSDLTMHFGLIPRSNRGIFCMNELPDLSAKIQVGMFNVLEERDIQIRGYPVRLDLDLCLVFSANPEDYTNRGRIVTPLKDRIGSVIRTHYPLTREIGIAITDANAWTDRAASPLPLGEGSGVRVLVPAFMKEILEETARLARTSQAINQQSGVSVRMAIANMENMVSNAERRALLVGENLTVPRVSDLAYLAASTRGKIELTLSEDDGAEEKVLAKLLGEAIKNLFEATFEIKQFRGLVEWFEGGKTIQTGDKLPAAEYLTKLNEIPILRTAVMKYVERPELQAIRSQAESALIASVMEFILEGLHVENKLNKSARVGETVYRR